MLQLAPTPQVFLMATIKLKKTGNDAAPPAAPGRAPVRGTGSGVKSRPTLAQAQAQRAEREARYQEQLRQRFGQRSPEGFTRRGEPLPAPPSPANSAFTPRSNPPQPLRNTANVDPRLNPRTDARGEARSNVRSVSRQPSTPLPTTRLQDLREQRAPARAPSPPQSRAQSPAQSRPETRPQPRSPARVDRKPRPGNEEYENEPAQHVAGSMRLSKRMSELGIASRREADEWIAKGWVRVDDHVVNELGSRVLPLQRITVDAKAKFAQAQRVTVLVNKPVGYVSGQAEDGYEPALVLITPANQWREDRSGTRFLREHLRSLVPAGRLDIDSVGLLVLTQDGRVAKHLIGEDSDVEKEYLVRVATPAGSKLSQSDLELLRHGLSLDGQALRPAHVEWVNDDQLRFVLRQGKKRQIRRMCEAVGLQVLGLKRVRIGSVMLGDLPAGQWRYLRADETFG
jgi:23S rRNA pseudouridine2604 synthase